MEEAEYNKRYEQLEKMIEKTLPNFIRALDSPTDKLLIHQDGFAADLQPEELYLLGAAIKVAGSRGKTIIIIGKNRSTV